MKCNVTILIVAALLLVQLIYLTPSTSAAKIAIEIDNERN